MPNLGGRPTKFNPERCQSIINYISKGIPYEIAAEANGICEDTLYEWIKIGKRDRDNGLDTEYSSFSEQIKKTEADKILKHLTSIDNKVNRWQAEAWILERRWWKYFSSKVDVLELEKDMKELLLKMNGDRKNEKFNSTKKKKGS